MDIYENIIIGNFLFGLGLKMGDGARAQGSEPTSISLFQQTPLDRPLSDLLFANRRIVRIFEFKRRQSDSDKEIVKREMLEDALSSPEMAELKKISREIHWYVESDYNHPVGHAVVMPYLDFLNSPNRIDLIPFIDRLVKEAAADADADEQTFSLSKKYLEVISGLSTGNNGESGTFIVSISREGELSFVHLPDVRTIFMTPQKILDRQLAIENALAARPGRSRPQGGAMSSPSR